ncbi:MAG: ATP synthase F0 subunit A [Clostridia bacterium]|nr:ATP synthase F0 subunit A [Clostridia bacterium]
MGDGGFGAKIMFTISEDIPIIGGVPVTETITTTWIIMAILIIGSIIFTRNLKRIPNGIQNIVETVVGSVYNLTETTMGSDKVGFAPYIGTLMMYLALANLAGLLGVRPPTADLNMTLSLALITFFMIHFNGIRRKGVLGYLKGFTEPFFLLTPINLIGEIATPISLSFRLFGNIVGGSIIMALVYSALAAFSSALLGLDIPILQVGVPAVLHVYFDVFSGLLQTFIFAMLTMVFVSGAMD